MEEENALDFGQLQTKKQHRDLNTKSGFFGVKNYKERHSESWSIVPPNAQSIKIQFQNFATNRHQDLVKIYEGSRYFILRELFFTTFRGEGALVAVLSGSTVPNAIVVNSSAAYVVFTSNLDGESLGFHASYTVQ